MVETRKHRPICVDHRWLSRRAARFLSGHSLAAALALVIATSSGCADGISGATATANSDSASSSGYVELGTKRTVDHSVQLAAHRVAAVESSDTLSSATVPSWAADAIFYQIFLE